MALIEIHIRTQKQLLDSLDPSPFHERSLDRNAHTYILECAGEYPPHEALNLLIQGPENMRPCLAEMTQAIHGHYRLAHTQALRRHRYRMRSSKAILLAGSVVMIASLALHTILDDWTKTAFGKGLAEGLLVLGWVALWRPIDMLLYERFESWQERQLLDKLAQIPVEFAAIKEDHQ